MTNYNTYRSRLIPYENEIIALRRKRPPMPYSQIADLLREKYQITVNRQSIFKFIKVRTKGYKPCQFAWNIELTHSGSKPTTETPPPPKPAVSNASKPTYADKQKPGTFQYTYSRDHDNLTRLSPEEIAAERAKLKKEMENR